MDMFAVNYDRDLLTFSLDKVTFLTNARRRTQIPHS